jgi:hypothetical protein
LVRTEGFACDSPDAEASGHDARLWSSTGVAAYAKLYNRDFILG